MISAKYIPLFAFLLILLVIGLRGERKNETWVDDALRFLLFVSFLITGYAWVGNNSF
jgi:hypothetical protein